MPGSCRKAYSAQKTQAARNYGGKHRTRYNLSAATAERPDLPGMLKIPYEDLKVEKDLIRHAAFGTVFACLWKGNPAAYKKFLHQHMSKRARQDFVKEIEILVSLDHPHIVKLYGAVLEEQRLGLVMEYMSRTLFHALFNDESEFENEKKMEMVSQLAGALQYLHLHSKQIAHCDSYKVSKCSPR